MSEEHNKNAVTKGLKIKLPTAVISEIGSPHATSTGKETSESRHWTCKKARVYLLIGAK